MIGKVESKEINILFSYRQNNRIFYTVGTDGNNLQNFVMYEDGGPSWIYIFKKVVGMGEYIAFYIDEYTGCFFFFFCDSK